MSDDELNKLAHAILSGPLPSPLDDKGFAADGWCYHGKPSGNGDARKIVTLEQNGMVWVGIRAYHVRGDYWMNNNEPEVANVIAWRDLNEPAKGRWMRGEFYAHD
jgi:hypothetical protein